MNRLYIQTADKSCADEIAFKFGLNPIQYKAVTKVEDLNECNPNGLFVNDNLHNSMDAIKINEYFTSTRFDNPQQLEDYLEKLRNILILANSKLETVYPSDQVVSQAIRNLKMKLETELKFNSSYGFEYGINYQDHHFVIIPVSDKAQIMVALFTGYIKNVVAEKFKFKNPLATHKVKTEPKG